MSNLSDELQKRMNDMPDKYTLAWWQKQLDEIATGYRGATHGINRCLAEYETCCNAIEALVKRCEMLEHANNERNATLGEVRQELQRVSDKVDTMAEWIKKHVPRKENSNGSGSS